MPSRSLPTLLFVAALLLAGLSHPHRVAAQANSPLVSSHVRAIPGLDDVARLFRDVGGPVRLYALDGPDSVAVGDEARFGALVNVEAAALPFRARWHFGDGAAARGLYAVHRYAAPGVYTVVFTAENAEGVARDTLRVVVRAAPPAAAGAGLAYRADAPR